MAKIIKAADWEGDFLNIYEQIERKDLSPNAIEHKWIPHGVAKQGTSLNANFLNEIQKNSIYGILETNYKNVDNIDKYTIMNFEGISDTGVFKDLKIKVLITNTNKYDSPKIIINSKEYSILYGIKSGIQNLKKDLFIENQVYNMTYNGIGFVIENGNFKATENELGTLTLNDVRKEIARLSGGPYGGLFGTELTSIIKDKMYIYINEDGNGSIYKALETKENSSGFITPTSSDFINITNNSINNKYIKNIEEYEFIHFPVPLGNYRFFRFGKRAFFFMFYQNVNGFSLTDGSKIASYPNNFKIHGAFIDTEFAVMNSNTSTAENARLVMRSDGIYIYGVNNKTHIELKGTLHYITE